MHPSSPRGISIGTGRASVVTKHSSAFNFPSSLDVSIKTATNSSDGQVVEQLCVWDWEKNGDSIRMRWKMVGLMYYLDMKVSMYFDNLKIGM